MIYDTSSALIWMNKLLFSTIKSYLRATNLAIKLLILTRYILYRNR